MWLSGLKRRVQVINQILKLFPMGIARAGSNPVIIDLFFSNKFFFFDSFFFFVRFLSVHLSLSLDVYINLFVALFTHLTSESASKLARNFSTLIQDRRPNYYSVFFYSVLFCFIFFLIIFFSHFFFLGLPQKTI